MAQVQSMPPVLVASHPRSGTHLMIDLLRNQFASCHASTLPGQSAHNLYLSLERLKEDTHRPISRAGATRILKRAARPTLKTHLLPGLEEIRPADRDFALDLVARATRLYCIRDGRAVLCSYRTFKTRGARPVSEFMRERVDGISRVARWAQHVRAWLAEPDVLPVRYEQVVANPREQLARLGEQLHEEPRWQEPLLPRRLRSRADARLARLLGRSSSTTIVGRPRGGKSLKWQEALDEADRRFFHEEAGDVLIELGYEADDAWVTAPATPAA